MAETMIKEIRKLDVLHIGLYTSIASIFPGAMTYILASAGMSWASATTTGILEEIPDFIREQWNININLPQLGIVEFIFSMAGFAIGGFILGCMGALIYNLLSPFTGGIKITLVDEGEKPKKQEKPVEEKPPEPEIAEEVKETVKENFIPDTDPIKEEEVEMSMRDLEPAREDPTEEKQGLHPKYKI